MRAWRLAPVLAIFAALAGACVPAVQPPSAPTLPVAPPGFPEAFYLHAAAHGKRVFRIDRERSQVVIHAYRGGTLARFGHDHAIASRDVRGYVLLADASTTSRADVYVALESLTVDEPALRAEAGFETQPSQKDIDGTRRNMLDKVLEVHDYPFVVLHLAPAEGDRPAMVLDADLSLHGVTRRLRIPVEVDTSAAGILDARGRFSVLQSHFGIQPFAVLGGALRVEDRLDLQFQLHARHIR